ncbi:MAG TPA: CoA transferase, partial [Solirubrobacterales bacterium]|nr:CoA transferase [Solirubrobacterales bacterium]
GQVVDAAIVDGAASVTGMLHGFLELGAWKDERGVNLLDGGAPFYDCYRCADGGWVAVGALEPQFYAALLEKLGLAEEETIANHLDPSTWPAIRRRFTAKFAERPRDEWHDLFADSDCCVAPVLSMREAREDGHNRDRGIFVEVGGMPQPAPAPRFSVTEPEAPIPARPPASGPPR